MGAVVAERLLKAGKAVSVWNRSPHKGLHLEELGARRSATVEGALQSSSVIILVLSDAATARAILAPQELMGKTIVNYSSGSEAEVESLQNLVYRAGGRFLNGAIMAYPRNIGHRETYFVYSGDFDALEQNNKLLEDLAGHSIFLSPLEARTFVAAFLVQAYVSLAGFYEALAAGRRLGWETSALATKMTEASRFFLSDAMEDAAKRLDRGDFSGDQATLDTHYWSFKGVAATMKARGADTPFYDVLLSKLEHAQSKGLGGEDISTLVNVFANSIRPIDSEFAQSKQLNVIGEGARNINGRRNTPPIRG
jgi:3-hydroxyisobutyrate dehydrogenase-like beta-hydroxyacid dehydrogenase